jgi:thioesterase domain-containing protein/aryl carrier-like protein
VDKKALPVPDNNAMLFNEYVAPNNAIEALQVQVWAQQLGLDEAEVGVTSNFFALGGNSISMLQMIAALSKAGITRTVKQFYEHPTISGMTEAVEQRSTQALVKLNQANEGQPLFVFHAIDGQVSSYHSLAEALADVCPVIGVQAPFNYGEDFSFDTLLTLAQYYVDAIKQYQPHGPYRLAGWSVGGVIAQKVAYLLLLEHNQVDYLALFDSFLIRSAQQQMTQRSQCLEYAMQYAFSEAEDLPRAESIVSRLDSDFVNQDYQIQLTLVADLLIKHDKNGYVDAAQLVLALRFFVDFIKAQRTSTPIDFSGQALLIQASHEQSVKARLLEGWGQYVLSPNRIISVDGDHGTMLQNPCLKQIVERLRQDLMKVAENS